MSGSTGIEYATATWNPILGCTRASAGCDHCWSIRQTWRMAHNPSLGTMTYQGLVERKADGSLDWTGELHLLHDRLKQPMGWRQPQTIFAASQADLFHPKVPESFIEQVYAIAALCQQHRFLILTKRADRLEAWYNAMVPFKAECVASRAERIGGITYDTRGSDPSRSNRRIWPGWPLPNVWLGVTVEDNSQRWRIEKLLKVKAARYWVSYEPAIGPLDLRPWLSRACEDCDGKGYGRDGSQCASCHGAKRFHGIDWVVAGCESGPDRRDCREDWMRSVRDQCGQARVPFYLKQLYRDGRLVKLPELDGRQWTERPEAHHG